MSFVMEKVSIGFTYMVALTGIVLDGDTTRKNVLFTLGLILFILQIILHVYKIKKAKKDLHRNNEKEEE